MPHVSKRPPSYTSCSFERSPSGTSLRPDEQVLDRCGADAKDLIEILNDGSNHFDALPTGGLQPETANLRNRWGRRPTNFNTLKNDQEKVLCCHTSMSADALLKEGSKKARTCEVITESAVSEDVRWFVLFDLQKREIESLLLNWLNAEVRDRLESVDQRLCELQERCTMQRCGSGLIQQTMKRASTNSTNGLITSLLQNSEQNSNESLERISGSASHEDKQAETVAPVGNEDQPTLSLPGALSKEKEDKRIAILPSIVAKKRSSHILCIHATIQKHENVRGRCAATTWRFLEDRFSSVAAYLWSLVIPGIVFMSLTFEFWQTVDNYPLSKTAGMILQLSVETVFAAELLLRFLVCPDRRSFCRNPFNVIDLLTCLPLVFRLGVAIASRSLEDALAAYIVLPVLRLLKLTRRFEKFLLLLDAFVISLEALPVLLYTMLMIAMTFAGLIYAAEPRDNIAHLPAAMWFVLVTMTTCGYGDVFPSTLSGKFISSLLMIVSILYTAMPIGIVGNAFSHAWDHRDRLLLMHRFREAFLQRGFSEAAFRDILAAFVGNLDDELGFEEFQAMLQTMNIHINVDRVQLLLHSLDEDGNGRVSIDELLGGLFPEDYVAYFSNFRTASRSLTTQKSYELDPKPSR